MSPLKTSLVVAVVSVVVTAGVLYYSRQGRVREARHLRSQNNRMLLEANQRVMARQSAAPAPASSEVVAVSAASNPTAAPVARMAEYYRNEGNATPLATMQTFAWACDRGDIETVQRLLFIEEVARPKVEAFVAALPENVRAQWKTVDETVAAILTESVMGRPFPRHDILATAMPEEVGASRVRLRMPNVPRDGTEYQQTAEGWKYVLTEKVVDAYIRQSRQSAR